MLQLAGQALSKLMASPVGKAMLTPASKTVAKAAIPQAAIGGGFNLLLGGGIPAAVAGGAADLGASYTLGRLAGKVTPQMLGKVMPQRAANFLAGAKPNELSVLQNIGMGTGSIGAALITAPMFAGQQIADLSQEQLQQLIEEPQVMDQTATAQQQLMQRDLINNLQRQALSPGTMFQMQGIESTLGRQTMAVPSQIDPYGIMR